MQPTLLRENLIQSNSGTSTYILEPGVRWSVLMFRSLRIFALALLPFLCLIGCGGHGSDSSPASAQGSISVSVSPTTSTVTIGQTAQFSAQVANTTNTAVTWAVNGTPGGNSTTGTISASGLYTAPGRVPTSAVSISATSSVDGTKSDNATVNVQGFSGMLSWHNDPAITGQNLKESTLTLANVNQTQFGKLASYSLDEQALAQPLYVANVPFPGAGTHNAIYVATEANTVFAFDADGVLKSPFWKKSLMPVGATPVDGMTTAAGQGGPITPKVGITGTPVIDGFSGTLFVVSVTQEGGTHVHRLHALDITTGNEKFGGPVTIAGSVPGTGAGSSNGQVLFDATLQLQRSALTIVNGVVYIAWASYQDWGNYHGWIIGYDASTLRQVRLWNATSNGQRGAIWMSGAPLSSDAAGNLYVVTGNGTFDADSGGKDYGDSFVKLTPNGNTFSVTDYFTPFDQANLALNDIDLGSSGLILLSNQSGPAASLGISAGKAGKIYLVDLDKMGHFQAGNDSQIVQSIASALGSQVNGNDFSTATYWQNNVYFAGNHDVIKQFKMNNGLLTSAPVQKGTNVYGYPGANMTISANGSTNGILWTIEAGALNLLHAYDASNVTNELYNSGQAPNARDGFGNAVRFTLPTVMNGKVYVAGQTQLAIFGLR